MYTPFVEEQIGLRSTDGAFEADGGNAGTWKLPITDCSSGLREGFYGVTFDVGHGAQSVRLVRAPIGPMMVALRGADGDYQSLHCAAVVGSIGTTGIRVNKVSVLAGQVQLVCDGLRGSARFSCS